MRINLLATLILVQGSQQPILLISCWSQYSTGDGCFEHLELISRVYFFLIGDTIILPCGKVEFSFAVKNLCLMILVDDLQLSVLSNKVHNVSCFIDILLSINRIIC